MGQLVKKTSFQFNGQCLILGLPMLFLESVFSERRVSRAVRLSGTRQQAE